MDALDRIPITMCVEMRKWPKPLVISDVVYGTDCVCLARLGYNPFAEMRNANFYAVLILILTYVQFEHASMVVLFVYVCISLFTVWQMTW